MGEYFVVTKQGRSIWAVSRTGPCHKVLIEYFVIEEIAIEVCKLLNKTVNEGLER